MKADAGLPFFFPLLPYSQPLS
nr:pyrBI operon leader peptide [Citrobacter rodentium]